MRLALRDPESGHSVAMGRRVLSPVIRWGQLLGTGGTRAAGCGASAHMAQPISGFFEIKPVLSRFLKP